MKGANKLMNNNINDPLLFSLPDGDSVAVIPWGYVVDKLTPVCNQITESIITGNEALLEIDTKLTEFVSE